ncbi:MAG: HAMP domain-containing protein [Acidimicrobiales bacterium]
MLGASGAPSSKASSTSAESSRSPFRARRTDAGKSRVFRLANSIRLPIWIGGAILLLIALLTGALVGRVDEEELDVPDVLLDFQESVTQGAAQSVRRGLNEGVEDLQQFAGVIAKTDPAGEAEEASLKALADAHGRYRSLYLLDGDRVVTSVGDAPELGPLKGTNLLAGAGILDAREANGLPLIQQFAPVPGGKSRVVVGHYDHTFFRYALDPVAPGSAWVVNRDGRIVASLGRFAPFDELPSGVLRDAAKAATGGGSGARRAGGGIDSATIVAYAPVNGPGPAGQLGWGFVTSRRIATLALPEVRLRRQAMVVAVVLGVAVLAIFGWIWVVVVTPILRLQKEAERLAYGDLSKAVEIVRYDEIGLIARALERIRVLVIRQKMHERKPGLRAPARDDSSS